MSNDKKDIGRIFHILRKTYGFKIRRVLQDPLDTLIETILSQNTSDRNSRPAFLNLKKRFRSWEAVRRASIPQIMSVIKPAGLYRIKSERIKNILEETRSIHGRPDLKFLKRSKQGEAESFLKGLKGVGPKTLSIVMLFSLGFPYFPVDTHIFRVTKRLGLIPKKMNIEDAHVYLRKAVLPKMMYEFHINLIMHGRSICKAGRPRCEICPLKKLCGWYREVFIRGRRPSR